jgi:serine/threonine protein kinase
MTKEIIDRYEIQSEIGRGGMAAVYLAYDPNFRRKVAIKLVSSNLREQLLFRERFEREAHLIARIEHPAIVPVYDYGEQDNNLYLVMRYMPGGSLAGKIKNGVLTLREAAQILSQIAPALDAVHAQGIVHRDLKPANILLDSFGNPAISDFGIAHFTSATSDLTGSAIIGTPSYMSPEQVRGDDDLDGRSDIYALGVILFEMLTGHGPFQSKTPLSIALQHLTDPIPSVRLFRSDLPMEVQDILDRAMAKDRELRYSTASEFALELRTIADTFRGDAAPALNPVKNTAAEEVATEVDVEEAPQPVSGSRNASQLEVRVEDRQRSNSDDSRKLQAAQVNSQESIDRSSSKRSSRGILQIAAIAVAGLFLFLLCGSLGLFGTWASFNFPGLFPEQSQTAPPASTSTQAANVQEIVLFSDDFSNPNSGWPTQEGYSYQQDGYHISAGGTDGVPWAKTGTAFDNTSVHVDAKPVAEGVNGYYGLLCRIQDSQNFYYFVIRNDGGYAIGKYKGAEFQSLFPEGWRQSDAINQGNQTNRLKADCFGDTLRFYANGVMLGEVNDTDLSSGFSGILAAALDTRGFEVTFNNFLVTKPGQ